MLFVVASRIIFLTIKQVVLFKAFYSRRRVHKLRCIKICMKNFTSNCSVVDLVGLFFEFFLIQRSMTSNVKKFQLLGNL